MLALLCLSFIAGAVGAPTSCSMLCSDVLSPVCGSNGKTYSSECLLYEASCQYQQGGGLPVKMVHLGACYDNRKRYLEGLSCNQICNEVKAPICASDGVVYENRCRYEVARCEASKNRTRLSIISFTSTCPTPIDPKCEKYSVNTSDIAVEGPLGDPIKLVCPQGAHEVCTNQGTYQSECHLCQIIDTYITKYKPLGYTAPQYKIFHDGPCNKGTNQGSLLGGYPG